MKKIICLLLVTAFIMPCLFSCADEIDSKPNTVIIDVEDCQKGMQAVHDKFIG